MRAWVGTSGWQYRSWRGPFYPQGLPQRAWLGAYASRFPVVEVNSSFYRLPAASSFARWREATPSGFLFAVKASRYITHVRRLRDARDPVGLLWSRASELGSKLGPVLFQTPPSLPVDLGALADLLSGLPPTMRPAFEFREPSWHSDEVLRVLDGAGAAWVLADRPGVRVPEIVTGGWTYVRFHQGRVDQPGYPREKLRRWAERIAAMPVREAFCFFNNDWLAAAPADATALAGLLEDCGCEVIRLRG